jgi:hypothetical protein
MSWRQTVCRGDLRRRRSHGTNAHIVTQALTTWSILGTAENTTSIVLIPRKRPKNYPRVVHLGRLGGTLAPQPPAPVPDLPCPHRRRRKSSNGGRRRRAPASFFFLSLGGLPSSRRHRSISEVAGLAGSDASSPALWWVLEHRNPLMDARLV